MKRTILTILVLAFCGIFVMSCGGKNLKGNEYVYLDRACPIFCVNDKTS